MVAPKTNASLLLRVRDSSDEEAWDEFASIYRPAIAIAGFFDIDEDSTSDQAVLIEKIMLNGGSISALHDDQGHIVGKIDSTVRYLVLGTIPKEGPSADKIGMAVESLKRQAEEHEVEVISLEKLLNWMGTDKGVR